MEWPVTGPRPGVEVLAVVAATVDDELLGLLPDLRLVAGYGVGYDEIDVEACARRGVAVTNTPDALGVATADLTMALVLASRRRVVEGDRFIRRASGGRAGWWATCSATRSGARRSGSSAPDASAAPWRLAHARSG